MTYANQTTVTVEKSRFEIERILTRYGATAFAYATDLNSAMIVFEADDRRVKFTLPIPAPEDFKRTATGRQRTGGKAAQHKAWEQACRSRWRALALIVKAKLEAVESGIVTFEDEFLAFIMLPDGTQVRDHTAPSLADAYDSGQMRALLPGATP